MSTFPPLVSIVGATATGKSRLALLLAHELGAEIVSADSRQVYRYLDIGTAKATPEERSVVEHHLIDIVDPDDTYSAMRFRRAGEDALEVIANRGRIALVVGGSGHYLQALLDRIAVPEVPPDWERRTGLELALKQQGLRALLARLEALDPATAARVDRANPRRVLRALEIVEATGAPIPPFRQDPMPALWLGLRTDRARLYERADRRVEDQAAAGLAEETADVLARGYSPALPSLNSLAYREMTQYVRGKITREEAIAAYKTSTHRLIRRQTTWFTANRRIVWLDATETLPVQEATEHVVRYLGG